MRINTDVLVEAVLMSHNVEHDAPVVQTIAYWLERSVTSPSIRLSNIAKLVNAAAGTNDVLRRMHCIQAFAHIVTYGLS